MTKAVERRLDEDEPGDQVRATNAGGEGDIAAGAPADHRCRAFDDLLEHGNQVRCVHPVITHRAVGRAAVSTAVVSHHLAACGQVVDHAVPGRHVRRRPVDQDERRLAGPAGRVAQPSPGYLEEGLYSTAA